MGLVGKFYKLRNWEIKGQTIPGGIYREEAGFELVFATEVIDCYENKKEVKFYSFEDKRFLRRPIESFVEDSEEIPSIKVSEALRTLLKGSEA